MCVGFVRGVVWVFVGLLLLFAFCRGFWVVVGYWGRGVFELGLVWGWSVREAALGVLFFEGFCVVVLWLGVGSFFFFGFLGRETIIRVFWFRIGRLSRFLGFGRGCLGCFSCGWLGWFLVLVEGKVSFRVRVFSLS